MVQYVRVALKDGLVGQEYLMLEHLLTSQHPQGRAYITLAQSRAGNSSSLHALNLNEKQ